MDSAPVTSQLTSPFPICASCGGVIGVYEPTIIRSPWGDVTEASLAQRGGIDSDDEWYHPACYPW